MNIHGVAVYIFRYHLGALCTQFHGVTLYCCFRHFKECFLAIWTGNLSFLVLVSIRPRRVSIPFFWCTVPLFGHCCFRLRARSSISNNTPIHFICCFILCLLMMSRRHHPRDFCCRSNRHLHSSNTCRFVRLHRRRYFLGTREQDCALYFALTCV